MGVKYVNTHLVTQVYGGPEEGGWWYTKGQPIESLRVELGADPDAAKGLELLKKAAQCWCDKENAERPDLYASNSRGVYEVRVQDGFAEHYPKERPHYE